MLDTHHNIFIVGIKGVAMTNLALILEKMGKKVTGSDTAETFITDGALVNSNIIVVPSFAPMLLPDDTDLVIYSAAHEGRENPQVLKAIEKDIEVKHQIEVIGEIMNLYSHSVAVAGCHGKTTTSSLAAYALINLKQNPGFIVGVSDFADQRGGQFGEHNYFVLEADEYGLNPPYDKTPKFFFINPDAAIITNIDFDHPDVYQNLEETKAAFLKFMTKVANKNENSRLYVCKDDEQVMEVARKLPPQKVITFGFDENADYVIQKIATNPTGITCSIKINSTSEVQEYTTGLFGEKNASNMTGVIAYLLHQGFKQADIQVAIQGFTGAKRRFELISSHEQMFLLDDYAHHPNEIKATIQAARTRFPESKIVILFQPHTYSRTKELKNEFIDALKLADSSILLPIFASAREKEDTTISSSHLVEDAKKQGIYNLISLEALSELESTMMPVLSKNCVICTMGAGDVYKLHSRLIPLMHKIDIY